MWLLTLAALVVFEAIADIFSKQWSVTGSILYWSFGLLGYIIANIFWLFSIREGSGLARGAIIFSVVSAVLAVIIGLVFYKESMTKVQLVGICVGVLAVVLIFWPDIQKTLFLK